MAVKVKKVLPLILQHLVGVSLSSYEELPICWSFCCMKILLDGKKYMCQHLTEKRFFWQIEKEKQKYRGKHQKEERRKLLIVLYWLATFFWCFSLRRKRKESRHSHEMFNSWNCSGQVLRNIYCLPILHKIRLLFKGRWVIIKWRDLTLAEKCSLWR